MGKLSNLSNLPLQRVYVVHHLPSPHHHVNFDKETLFLVVKLSISARVIYFYLFFRIRLCNLWISSKCLRVGRCKSEFATLPFTIRPLTSNFWNDVSVSSFFEIRFFIHKLKPYHREGKKTLPMRKGGGVNLSWSINNREWIIEN